MKFAKIIDNVVVQVQPNEEDGFIIVNDNVFCGMVRINNTFVAPEIEKSQEDLKISILCQISELETQQARPLRELLIDSNNEFAKTKLKDIDYKISILRVQL